jgi:SpoVK/Ycf46/Vps4 family AAA+-type ATPase
MGIFVAEGCIDSGRMAFTTNKNEEELKKIIIEKMKKCFGLENYKITIPRKKNSIRIRFSNAEVSRWFDKYHKKEIPPEILLSPNDVAAAFLRGLFEGDGSPYFVTKKRMREYGSKVYKYLEAQRTVSLKSSSRLLLEQVQVLLLRWGIVGRIYEYESNRGGYSKVGYVLLIRGKQNLELFHKHIGFLSAKKSAKLLQCIKSYKRNLKMHLPREFERIREIKRINEWIRVYDFEIPSTHSFFTNGILSHNTGKTLLAKAVANESGANFISISGPEIFSKWYGQTEENLRKIFEEAEKNAPSIIFIDEIDAIAPKREEVTGEVERRTVAQLLALMDGLKKRGKVIVIAATNRPHSLDPALRRAGRFDREIEFPVPDRNGRLEILKIHTRNMPLAKDVDLEHIADITHGYVGADIMALCKEAAMAALRRVLPEIKWKEKEGELPKEVLEKLVVTKADFDAALQVVEPSAMREVLIEVPKVKWEDIGGLDDVKQQLREMIEWPLKHPESFKRLGIKPPKGILLYGPPGCGKTLLAQAVANEAGVNFISVKGPEVYSMWVGESERRIRELFRRARQVAPSIIFLDEIDALAPRRGYYTGTRVTETVVSQLLTELSGIEELKGVVVIAATNRPDLIDPALLRPGRIDRHVLVPPPDAKTRLKIFQVHTRKQPLAKDVDLEELVKRTENYSGADIEAVCREAAMNALRENINAKEIKMRHFEQALEKVKPSLTKEIIEYYEQFAERQKKAVKEEAPPPYIG